jgi:hypothetical protein
MAIYEKMGRPARDSPARDIPTSGGTRPPGPPRRRADRSQNGRKPRMCRAFGGSGGGACTISCDPDLDSGNVLLAHTPTPPRALDARATARRATTSPTASPRHRAAAREHPPPPPPRSSPPAAGRHGWANRRQTNRPRHRPTNDETPAFAGVSRGSGGRIRTCDLRVMRRSIRGYDATDPARLSEIGSCRVTSDQLGWANRGQTAEPEQTTSHDQPTSPPCCVIRSSPTGHGHINGTHPPPGRSEVDLQVLSLRVGDETFDTRAGSLGFGVVQRDSGTLYHLKSAPCANRGQTAESSQTARDDVQQGTSGGARRAARWSP